MKIIYDISKRSEDGLPGVRGMSNLSAATSNLIKAIMTERKIIGLRTKPIVFKNPEDIEEYKIMMGYKEPPVDRQYRETKAAIETLDRMIERRQRLQAYIDDIEQRGSY